MSMFELASPALVPSSSAKGVSQHQAEPGGENDFAGMEVGAGHGVRKSIAVPRLDDCFRLGSEWMRRRHVGQSRQGDMVLENALRDRIAFTRAMSFGMSRMSSREMTPVARRSMMSQRRNCLPKT